jgi:tetratricopeptide (TPR) repeat protein
MSTESATPVLPSITIADASDLPNVLATLATFQLAQKKYVEAEPVLRECLAIRTELAPDAWNRFNTQSWLGEALLGQKKYAEAEPLLTAGYEGLKQREATIPLESMSRLPMALERLVLLYEAWGKPDEAAKWRHELEVNHESHKSHE